MSSWVSKSLGICMVLSFFSKAFTAMTTVGMPAASKALDTCPTDMWQTGQTGTSTAASAPAPLIFSTHSGRIFLISRFWEQAPTKE